MPEPNEPNAEHTPPEPDAGDSERLVYAFPVQVRAAGDDSAELLRLARAAAQDPSIFEEEGREPYFWSAVISSSELDSYYTHMLPSTLRNFAEEATAGVAFMNSHRTGGWFSRGELPLGRSLRGKFIGGGGNGISRTQADFYTIPGLQLGEVSTDQAIAAIRSGIGNDVSVGFHLGSDGRYVCDLCGEDYLHGDCTHWLGFSYEVEESRAKKKTKKKCTAGIDNGHLSEVSLVYDGATPGAAILKATRAMEAGLLTPETARLLESQYRIKLPGARHNWSGVTFTDNRGAYLAVTNGTVDAPSGDIASVNVDAALRQLDTDAVSSTPPDGDYYAGKILARVPGTGETLEIPCWLFPDGRIATQTVTGSSSHTLTLRTDAGDPTQPASSEEGARAPEGDAISDTPPATDAHERKEAEMPENTAAGGTAPAATTDHAAELAALRGQLSAETERAQAAETALAALREALGETPVEQLRMEAADGRSYRDDLLEELAREAVRAFGVRCDKEKQKQRFATADLADIKEQTTFYRERADAALPEGRVTRDVDPAALEARNGAAAPVEPNRLYAG